MVDEESVKVTCKDCDEDFKITEPLIIKLHTE